MSLPESHATCLLITSASAGDDRHQLKAGTLVSLECPRLLLEELGVQALNASFLETEQLVTAIDAVSLSDLKEAAARVLKGKVAIAAVGQTANVPFVEDLV